MFQKISKIAKLKNEIENRTNELNRLTERKYEYEFKFMNKNLSKVIDEILDKEIEEITK